MTRREELAANLAELRRRIEEACLASERDPGEVAVIAVTKTWPAADVRLLAELGLTDVGENRDQEAAPKARECEDLDLTWHFVGQLQTNKARSVASYASVVHSVDRRHLVTVLGRETRRCGRVLRCLVQVDLDDRPGRAGVEPEGALELGDEIAGTDGLSLAGVMAMAPLAGEPEPAFRRLAEIGERLRAAHPGATIISAGMSGDLAAAIAAGSTHVRVGTALLGTRHAHVV